MLHTHSSSGGGGHIPLLSLLLCFIFLLAHVSHCDVVHPSHATLLSCSATKSSGVIDSSTCNDIAPYLTAEYAATDALVQTRIASLIPDMDTLVTLSLDVNSSNNDDDNDASSSVVVMVLSKTTLGNLRKTQYTLQHPGSGMEALVSFPDTFKPIEMGLYSEALTSGNIMSIYSLPAMSDTEHVTLALSITHANSSAPLHLEPVDTNPQISMSVMRINATGEVEPVIARNMRYPPVSFVSVLLTTAPVHDNWISDRVDHAYGSPECFRLDMETGVYTQSGMLKPKNNGTFSKSSMDPSRYTIRCDSDRLEIFGHTSITVLFVKPESWATLIYVCVVIGIGLVILSIMMLADADAICVGRPRAPDLNKHGTMLSELLRSHMWLSLLFGIVDIFKPSKRMKSVTGTVSKQPPEWSIRKYQNLLIWISSLVSYSIGAIAFVSILRSPSYFPLDKNPAKDLNQDYWFLSMTCALVCGKGVHIILDMIFSRFRYTFLAIAEKKEAHIEHRNSSAFGKIESFILGRPFSIIWNIIPMTVSVLFVAGTCYCTIHLGLRFDQQATNLWKIGTFASVALDIIILDPAYLGLRAFVLSFFQSVRKEKPEKFASENHALQMLQENDTQESISLLDVKENEKVQSLAGEKSENAHARDRWIVWLLTLFTWEFVTPMVFKGVIRPLEMSDLQNSSEYDKSSTLTERLNLVWEPMRYGLKKRALLLRSIIATFGARLLTTTFLSIIADGLTVVSPLIMQEVIKYLMDLSLNPLHGYLLIAAMFLCNYVSATALNQTFDVAIRLGMNIRSALASSVYRKSLVLSNKARQSRSTGQIVNLMSIDAEKFQFVMPYIPWIVTSIMQITISLGFLFIYLGYAAFFALGIMLALVPLNIAIMYFFETLREKILRNTDKRVKTINELLQSIRIVKFFAWESSFTEKINHIRRNELIQYVGIAICSAGMGIALNGAPIIISVGTFGIYAAIYDQEKLTPDIIFPSMAYLNILRYPMSLLPMMFAMCIDLSVSLGRIGSFLQEEELQKDAVTIVEDSDDIQNSISIENAYFEWETLLDEDHEKKRVLLTNEIIRDDEKQVEIEMKQDMEISVTASNENTDDDKFEVGKLIDVDLKIPKGSLTAIVGAVGSGKSSLLCSLIGDMKKTQGTVALAGSIAYCAQSAWLINDTVRGNITFGKRYDEDKYRNTIKVCALETDLKILLAGDETEIGEQGVNLSGGQRQRISLARAVYSDADIYLLDDPLSAVDAHVGRYLFDECISGHLKSKTRVLVTHQIQHIHKADYVVVMDQGRIVEQGTFNELMNNGTDGILVNMMSELQDHKSEDEDSKEESTAFDTDDVEIKLTKEDHQNLDDDTVQPAAKSAHGALMTLEERTTGRLTFKNIMFYVMACGGPILVSLVMALYVVAQTGMLMTDWWLAQWTSNKHSQFGLGEYLGIYISIGTVSMVLVFFRDTIFSFLTVIGSKNLHEKMLKRIIRAPSSFFDTTPIGRILNRFSKDMESVDQMLGQTLVQFFTLALQIIGNCALMIIAMYWLSIPVVIFSVIYLIIQQIYTASFREIKRIDAISRSPVYSHASESLTGLSTIRAYGRQRDFIQQYEQRLDTNIRAFRMQNDVQRWLTFRLDLIGSLCTLAIGILAMILRDTDLVDPSLMSLALTYSLSMTMMLNFMVMNATEAEAAFASVERIAYYVANVPVEPPAIISNNRPPQEWPHKGEIVFENVDARYRPELPLVIKDISLHIKSNEKIGVVGRTGSGKSTIMLLLFRMFDIAAGRIIIDGININDIGLHDLRSKIAIIPQEPILFTGTIRSNLDPFNNYTDKYLWEALERANLKETIENLENGLDAPVSENGENFSVGQRQLICLARALCKQSKILILDEASASLDFATDALIQKTVREAFADCTCLTIAHRLNTIIDSDRVLVLDQGRIMEFDSPRNLFLQHPDGMFSSLANETGQANAALLRSIALDETTFDTINDTVDSK